MKKEEREGYGNKNNQWLLKFLTKTKILQLKLFSKMISFQFDF